MRRSRGSASASSSPPLRARCKSIDTLGMYLGEVPFLPFNSMAQWLCWWPTFPEEWNSDCGQKRRENGIGPEEPLRWKVKENQPC